MNTKVAEAVEREDGQWSITRSIDGETTNTIVRDSLPEGAETLEDGRTITDGQLVLIGIKEFEAAFGVVEWQ